MVRELALLGLDNAKHLTESMYGELKQMPLLVTSKYVCAWIKSNKQLYLSTKPETMKYSLPDSTRSNASDENMDQNKQEVTQP